MQQVSRIQNRPMKSPSPDIASRNKIKDTKAPIDDVRRYLDKCTQSKSPRPTKSPLSSRHPTIEELLLKIAALETANQQLKAQNLQLREINNRKQDPPPHRIIQIGASQPNSSFQTPRSVVDNTQILQRMQDRLMDLAADNNRLSNLLQEWKRSNEDLQKENQIMKQSLTFFRQGGEGMKSDGAKLIKDYYQNLIQPEMRKSQSDILSQLEDFKLRLNKLQSCQRHIEEEVLLKGSIASPTREKKDFSTSRKTGGPEEGTSGFRPEIKPFNQDDEREKGQPETCPRCPQLQKLIHSLEDRVKSLMAQSEILREEAERALSRSASAKSSKMKASTEAFLKNKIKDLEEELEGRIIKASNLEKDYNFLKDQSQRKIEKLERDMALLQNQLNTEKLALKQEKQKFIHEEQMKHQMQQRCKVLSSQLQSNNIQVYKKELKQHYENKEEGLKNYYEEQLRAKDQDISEQLQGYLQLLHNIRSDIVSTDIDGMIQQNEAAVNEKLSIEKQLLLIQQENHRIISELKRELTKKGQEIIEHEKANNMLKIEVDELLKQKDKLKELMLQMDEFKPILQVDSSQSEPKPKKYRSQTGCRLKSCLKDTLRKIDDLELQITQILREDAPEP